VLRGEALQPSTFTVGSRLDHWLDLCQLGGLRPRTIADYAGKLRLYVGPRLGHFRSTRSKPT
jgi:hypothetical protein